MNAVTQNQNAPRIPGRQRRHDRGQRVDGPPDVHGVVDERHVRHAEDRHRRGELVRAGPAVLPHQQVGEEDQLEQEAQSSASRPSATRRPTPSVAQSGPVTRPIAPKSTAISAAETARSVGAAADP